MRTSAEQMPSLHRVAPGYLKVVTSSKFWSFMLIYALMSFVNLELQAGKRKPQEVSIVALTHYPSAVLTIHCCADYP